nr:glycosyl-phosphatidylinositol-anchored molecule-like protein isoform X1 [Bubalus bubalis]
MGALSSQGMKGDLGYVHLSSTRTRMGSSGKGWALISCSPGFCLLLPGLDAESRGGGRSQPGSLPMGACNPTGGPWGMQRPHWHTGVQGSLWPRPRVSGLAGPAEEQRTQKTGSPAGRGGWPASPSSVRKVQALTGMMLLFAFLLFMGLPLGFVEPWTFNVQCHECIVKNTFHCPVKRTCPYHIRRCFTVSMRLNSREILVYKNCTFNCTFLYRAQEPQETPRRKTTHRFNSFYWVNCCGSNMCNFGGPTNLERDITVDYPLEEDIEGNAQLVQSTVFLSIVSILVRNTLM